MKNRGMKNVITFYKRLFEVHIFGIKYKQSPKEGGGRQLWCFKIFKDII